MAPGQKRISLAMHDKPLWLINVCSASIGCKKCIKFCENLNWVPTDLPDPWVPKNVDNQSITKSKAKSTKELYPLIICTHLRSRVLKILHCQLCSTQYVAVWINSFLKSTSAIEAATKKISDDFCFKHDFLIRMEVIMCLPTNQNFPLWMGHKGGHW